MPSGAVPLTPIALWPADVLNGHLVSPIAETRMHALAMALQPDAPLDLCVEALVEAASLNEGHQFALPLVAVALGSVKPAHATEALRMCLADLTHRRHSAAARSAAAHGLWRHTCMPASAAAEVAMMLVLDDTEARKIALFALKPYARQYPAMIAAAVASVTPDKWTSEALAALAMSAKDDAAARRTVEAYVMKSLADQPIVPTGIAGYVALAELNSGGAGLAALGSVVAQATDPEHLKAALLALAQMGELARPVARAVAQRLTVTDVPEQEELLCRTLVQIKAYPGDIPMQRVLLRVGTAPFPDVVPFCMLLTLYPQDFANTASVVKKRYDVAEEPVKAVLVQTYKTLTKIDLSGSSVATGSK